MWAPEGWNIPVSTPIHSKQTSSIFFPHALVPYVIRPSLGRTLILRWFLFYLDRVTYESGVFRWFELNEIVLHFNVSTRQLYNIIIIRCKNFTWYMYITLCFSETLYKPQPWARIFLCITVTSLWARWRLKSPASRLFTQPFNQVQIKENTKARRHWPLCGEFTGNSPVAGEFPADMANNAEYFSIWWRHHGIQNAAYYIVTTVF